MLGLLQVLLRPRECLLRNSLAWVLRVRAVVMKNVFRDCFLRMLPALEPLCHYTLVSLRCATAACASAAAVVSLLWHSSGLRWLHA